MHEYLKFFGTNNQQKIDRFLIYERDLLIRVFIYCLFYTITLVIISAFSGTHNFIYSYIENSFIFSKTLFHIVNYLVFNFILIFFFFLMIQLGSFIYNIYHTIMMTIVAYPDLYKFKIGEDAEKKDPH